MKNKLSNDLHDYGRSNESANSEIYETLEIFICGFDLGKSERCLGVE
jgi:hypothetical protein